jgi:hypothetical protein
VLVDQRSTSAVVTHPGRGVVAEAEGGSAEVFEAAVDRFGGPLLVPDRSK